MINNTYHSFICTIKFKTRITNFKELYYIVWLHFQTVRTMKCKIWHNVRYIYRLGLIRCLYWQYHKSFKTFRIEVEYIFRQNWKLSEFSMCQIFFRKSKSRTVHIGNISCNFSVIIMNCQCLWYVGQGFSDSQYYSLSVLKV